MQEFSHDHDNPTPAAPQTPGVGVPPDQMQGPAAPPRVRVRVNLPHVQPIFTYILLASIILVYLFSQVFTTPPEAIAKGYSIASTEEWLLVRFAKINEFILQDGEYYRLLTSIFLHGGIAHLFFNGYALYIIGRGIEGLYGHVRFLLIYFLGGLTASLASLVFNPGAASVGASGALFAIFGAEMVFLYKHRQIFGDMARRRLTSLVQLLLLNLFIGLVGGGVIDNWAHIGGFLGGLGLAWLIGPVFKPLQPAPGATVIEVEDLNPLTHRLYVPLIWLAGIVLGVLAMQML